MTDVDNRPHYVYRYYDAEGTALYIGCTHNIANREAQHSRKEWWPQVANRVVDQFPNKFGGRRAEEAWIQREQPLYNVQRKYAPTAGDPLYFQMDLEIAAEPHRLAEIIDRYRPAIQDRINQSTAESIQENKQWRRTQRRLRESRYRAARHRRKSA